MPERRRKIDIAEQREELLLAALPHVVFDGWTDGALRSGAADLELPEVQVLNLYPGGPAEAIEAFSAWADRGMLAAFEEVAGAEMRVSDRVALAVRLRLELLEPHKEAVRRGLAFFALPPNGPLGLKCLYRTVDAVWYAVGDRSTDYNFYTKRLLLAGVLSSTLVTWLNDRSEGHATTWAFLDRRISDVVRVGGRLGKTVKSLLDLPDRAFGPGGLRSGLFRSGGLRGGWSQRRAPR